MGRWKKGKPKRPGRPVRSAAELRAEFGATLDLSALERLDPPGSLYKTWLRCDPDEGPSPEVMDHLSATAPVSSQNVYMQIMRLARLYGGTFPEAALVLDDLLSLGAVPMRDPEEPEGFRAVPLSVLSLDQAALGHDPAETADVLHLSHAGGLLLVHMEQEPDDEHPVPMVRFVVERPAAPGGRWLFLDESDTSVKQQVTEHVRTKAGLWEGRP